MAYEIDLDKVPVLRAFKITDEWNSVQKRVMVSTLRELKMKAKSKLDINSEKNVKVLEKDGTELDEEDVFQSLQDETLFKIIETGNIVPPAYEENKKVQYTVSFIFF